MNSLESANIISQEKYNKPFVELGEFEKRQIAKILSGKVRWETADMLVSNSGKIIYIVTCSKCGGRATIPFKPDGKRPVYCKSCFHDKTVEDIQIFNKRYSGKDNQ